MPLEMSGQGKVVCVTGASGYIASWIVKLLLLRGYTVKATVRDPKDKKKTDHLLALDGAKERLQLLKANLVEEGSFEHAIDGCEAVFHTASPVALTVTDPQAELIEPAVKGTINVLKTCTKVSSVKRVIVTSSMAAVLSPKPPLGPNDLVDETTFSDPSVCEDEKQWYVLSKTLAEDAAWRFAKANNIDLIVMNPGLVIGPALQPTLNFSVDVVVDFINGDTIGSWTNEGMDMNSMTYKVSVEKLKSLGIELTPTETSLRDTVLSLKEKCLV
ncbi:unnamed protein product [Thlaspi arvense]|uniref:NAD-dependent epimerase/dehydratase domain-containing protein n=1 Tax=Thlaspi arvense TaxID=13288 RepID=A0AAU9RCS3_THLAR|nr:unnamed protein product [Thlaspi arvense]